VSDKGDTLFIFYSGDHKSQIPEIDLFVRNIFASSNTK